MVNLPFDDRATAGRALAEALAARSWPDAVVLALPRGGVPVAREVARRLALPLDLVLVRKIGLPGQPELAMAALVDGNPPQLVINPSLARLAHRDPAYLAEAEAAAAAEIARRRARYLANRAREPVTGRTAILVDDGLATGTSMRAAVEAMRAQGAARVVVAVPVAPPDTAEAFATLADEVVCLATPDDFMAVGQFYQDFHQLDDAEVRRLMADAPSQPPRSA